MREVIEQFDIGDISVEEIFPYTAEFSHNLVTIVSDDDIKGTKFWSDKTL